MVRRDRRRAPTEAREVARGLPHLDQHLDRNVTIIDWEKTADEMDAVADRGRTPAEVQALLAEWRESRKRQDVPEVEDFPCHPRTRTRR